VFAYSSRVSVLEQRVEGIDLTGLIPGLGCLCASSVGLVELCDRSSVNALLQQGLEGEFGTQAVNRPL
jgi:hypothetical protein